MIPFLRPFNYHRKVFLFVSLAALSLASMPVFADDTGHYQAATDPDISIIRNGYDVAFNSVLGFPAASSGPSAITLMIRNDGAMDLNLASMPAITVTGANPEDFMITQPAISVLAPGQSTTFTVTYMPQGSGIRGAQLSIASNDPDTNPFTLQLKGPQHTLYGPVYPPEGTISAASTGEAGRVGGRTLMISGVSLGVMTQTYWGPQVNSAGEVQLKVSLDGSTYTGQENLTFDPANSDLPNGKARWIGVTRIQNHRTGSLQTVYIRATLTTTNASDVVLPLTDPLSIGLSEQVGGLIPFVSTADYLKANFFIEASTSLTTGFVPYLNFYDAYPTPPGPLPGQGIGAAYSSINSGFYWINLPPKLTSNNILELDEGTSAVITTASLNASDKEDGANPQSILFEFAPNPEVESPLSYGTGVLKLDGTVLQRSDGFTLKDIQDGKLSYEHNGGESVYEEFQFSVKDSKGAYAVDGPHSVYNFRISIAGVNDLPVAPDYIISTSFVGSHTDILVATDGENDPLTYEVVTQPTSGTVVLNTATGEYVYTPSEGATTGSDSFTYRASDGAGSGNTATVTINIINLPPEAQDALVKTHEGIAVDHTLLATDQEGKDVSFQIVTPPSKGAVTGLTADGSYAYVPDPGQFGYDHFTYTATDADGETSPAATVTIEIFPGLDEGDILFAARTKILLVDPVTLQDTTLSEDGLLSRAQNLFYKHGTSIFVLDQSSGLIKINAKNGDQTLLTPAVEFSSEPGPLGIALAANGKLVIADGPNGIVEVDTTSGTVNSLFTGGLLGFPTGVLPLKNGDLIVTDAAAFFQQTSRVLRITPDGSQSVVSDAGLLLPVDLALLDDDHIIISDGGAMFGQSDRLIKISLVDGSQEVLTTGDQLGFPSGIDYQRFQQKLYAVNQGNSKLLSIDPETGVQVQLATYDPFEEPFGLMVIQRQNESPVIQELADLTDAYGAEIERSLYDLVNDDNDPDDALVYSVTSSNEEAVQVSVENGVLTLDLNGVGTSGISLSVTDSEQLMSTSSFEVVVTRAPLTITANDQEKYYGEDNPLLTASYSGFVNGDDENNIPPVAIETTASAGSPVGDYPITLTVDDNASENYAITVVAGSLTVKARPLTITADAKSKTYGEANPELTMTIHGFIAGEDASFITLPMISTIATEASPAGLYDIMLTGGAADNYDIELVNGILTIDKADQVITFEEPGPVWVGEGTLILDATTDSDLPIEYSADNPAVATVSGNSIMLLTAGTVNVTASQAGDENYNAAEPVSVLISVVKMDQMLTFDDIPDMTFGDPAFDVVVSSTTDLPITLSTTSAHVSVAGLQVTLLEPGEVTLTASQSGDGLYNDATPVSKTFCIRPATPVITMSADYTQLISSSANGNEWYLNGVKISGATSQALTLNASGLYTVRVVVEGCSSAVSDVFPVIVTEAEELFATSLRLYPNPVSTTLVVTLPTGADKQLRIVDVNGKGLLDTSTSASEMEVDVQGYAKGNYVVMVRVANKTFFGRFIKK